MARAVNEISSLRVTGPNGVLGSAVFQRSRATRINSRSITGSSIARAASYSHSSSVDDSEVAHFDRLASTWWDVHGSSRLLHLMNPLRHDFIRSCLSSQYSPSGRMRYLDVGCGGGIFAESAARLPDTQKVLGIDPSKEGIAVARRHARQDPLVQQPAPPRDEEATADAQEGLEPRLTYLQTSIEDLPVPRSVDEQYDVLTLFEVLEHVTHPADFLRACSPFVKPGGWIVLSTIARTWTSWLTTKVVAEDLIRLVPRGTHDWAKYINEPELREWFEAQPGWGRTRAQGVVYIPGLGWKEVRGGESLGNYFFGVRKTGTRTADLLETR